jgi:uncharacterized repeat protein (TIGR01451 family)
VNYTITVTNTGTVAASGVVVADSFPSGIASADWTCMGSGGAICPAPDSGGPLSPPTALLNQTILSLPVGGTVIYTIHATAASAGVPPTVVNTATANVPGGLCTDAGGAPTGETMPCAATVTNPALPVLSITKSADKTAALTAGDQVVYTITASNTGAASATHVTVIDPLPAGIASAIWTCTGSGGAVCPAGSGTGGLNESGITLPANGSLTYTITATLATAGVPASIVNIASIDSSDGGVCLDGTALPCKSGAVTNAVTKISTTNTAAPVPALDARALVALALLLGLAAAGAAWRHPRGVKRS